MLLREKRVEDVGDVQNGQDGCDGRDGRDGWDGWDGRDGHSIGGCEGVRNRTGAESRTLATAATSMASARLFSCANEKSQVTLRFCAANRKQ